MPEPRPVPEIPAIEQVALPDVVRDADHRIGVDISRIEVADWLAPDETFVDQLREKQRLHAARAPVFDALPESAPAQSELLAMLVEHLPCHHPSLYRREGDALRVVPLDLLVDIDASPLPPLLRAGWLVQEDLCLLDGDAPHRLLAASLSFPSRWRLGDKLGRPLVAIHDPVPGFERTLADPVSRVFARLTPGNLLLRENWSVLDSPALYQPTRGNHGAAAAAVELTHRLWVRSERQTLRRLPSTGAIVFTIGTRQVRLDRHLARPGQRQRLARQLATMSAETVAYKALGPYREALLALLATTDA